MGVQIMTNDHGNGSGGSDSEEPISSRNGLGVTQVQKGGLTNGRVWLMTGTLKSKGFRKERWTSSKNTYSISQWLPNGSSGEEEKTAITWEGYSSLEEVQRSCWKAKSYNGDGGKVLDLEMYVSNLEMRSDTGWPGSPRLLGRTDINRDKRQIGVKPNCLQHILMCWGCVSCGVGG